MSTRPDMDDRWQRVARAAADACRVDAEADLAPPHGFVTRVAARGAELRRERTLALWRRWSLRAALGSACLCAVAVFYAVAVDGVEGVERGERAEVILPVPEFQLPRF